MTSPNKRKLISVFPDYCSTGLWKDHINVDPSSLGVSSGLQIALKYWHTYWESYLVDDGFCGEQEVYEDELVKARSYYKKQAMAKWTVHGYELARLMTNENGEYEFRFIE